MIMLLLLAFVMESAFTVHSGHLLCVRYGKRVHCTSLLPPAIVNDKKVCMHLPVHYHTYRMLTQKKTHNCELPKDLLQLTSKTLHIRETETRSIMLYRKHFFSGDLTLPKVLEPKAKH